MCLYSQFSFRVKEGGHVRTALTSLSPLSHAIWLILNKREGAVVLSRGCFAATHSQFTCCEPGSGLSRGAKHLPPKIKGE